MFFSVLKGVFDYGYKKFCPPPLIYSDDNSLQAAAVTVTSSYSGKLQASNYGSNVVTIDASARTKAINITGNAKNNSIIGGSGNDTLNGGAGDDYLTGGAGKDIFVYDGGNDIITDYASAQDTLKMASGTVSGYSFDGDDAIFTVGKGSVKVLGGRENAVTVVDSKKKTFIYQNGFIQNNSAAKATAITMTSAHSGTITAADYGAAVATIDASARKSAVNITGNAKNNKITGTAGNDTLSGGSGKNTLIGGAGNDLFIYNGGNDVIGDYAAGQDTIQIASGAISSYSASGKDVSLKIGKGTLKIAGGKTAALTILDAENKVNVYQGGLLYGGEIASAKALSVTSVYGNTLSAYGAAVETIDASAKTKAMNINGNAKDNHITGTKKNDKINGGDGADSIYGGAGNDTLTGGAGADVFIYGKGDGKDVITDYESGRDKIKLTSGSLGSYSVKGSDGILKIGTGTITLKNIGSKAITVVDENDELKTFDGGLIYNNVSVAKSTGVTINSDYSGEEFWAYGASVETINASARKNAIDIVGNMANNYILGGTKADTIDGGAGSDTIEGGKGNDVLTGGFGADVFVYNSGDGNDTITDYSAGDIISLASGSISSYSVQDGNAIFKVGSNSLTVNDAAITIVGANSTASIYSGGKVSTKKWTGLDTSGVDTVYVTTPAETINVTVPAETINVTIPAETVNVTMPAETVTVGGNDDTVFVTIPAETVTVGGDTVTVTVEAEPVTITMGGGGESVIGTSKAETLTGTAGNDTVSLGGGKDVYIYNGGFDIITDYTEGDDKISLNGNIGGMVLGNDIYFAVGDGVLKLNNAKDKKVTIISGDTETEYVNGAVSESGSETVPVDNGVTVTLDSNLSGNFSLTSYNTTAESQAVNIDASNVKNAINVYGDNDTNIIRAAKSGGWIYAGKGDDTVYFGNGNDSLAHYSEYTGNKIVYNYRTEDIIWLARDAPCSNFSLDGDDVILNMTNGGTITLKDSKDKSIRIVHQYNSDLTRTIGRVTFSGDTVSLNNNYSGAFYLTSYADSAANIDASNAVGSIEIHADNEANIIRAAKNGSNIYAGKGDDTIYCGNGKDQIRFYQYDGNETIYNIGNEDELILNNCTAQNVSVSGEDVIITTSSEETITLKEGTGKRIFITGQNWQTYESKTSTSADIIDDFWFIEDDNFIGGDLDSLIDNDNSLTNANFNPIDAENIFAQDNPTFAYNSSDKK